MFPRRSTCLAISKLDYGRSRPALGGGSQQEGEVARRAGAALKVDLPAYGHELAQYKRRGEGSSVPLTDTTTVRTHAPWHAFTGSTLQVTRPIQLNSEVIGTVFVSSDLDELRTRAMAFVRILVLVLFGASGVASGAWPPWFPLLVFLPFIADATLTLARRAWRGECLVEGHRGHFYQRLHQLGAGHAGTLAVYVATMLGTAVTGLACRNHAPAAGWWALAAWTAVVCMLFATIDYHWRKKTNIPAQSSRWPST